MFSPLSFLTPLFSLLAFLAHFFFFSCAERNREWESPWEQGRSKWVNRSTKPSQAECLVWNAAQPHRWGMPWHCSSTAFLLPQSECGVHALTVKLFSFSCLILPFWLINHRDTVLCAQGLWYEFYIWEHFFTENGECLKSFWACWGRVIVCQYQTGLFYKEKGLSFDFLGKKIKKW